MESNASVLRWLGMAREVNQSTGPEGLCEKDFWIHPNHAGRLDEKTMAGWVLTPTQAPDYYNYYPIHQWKEPNDGKRFGCIYVVINSTSPLFGRLFRLTTQKEKVELGSQIPQSILDNLNHTYPKK